MPFGCNTILHVDDDTRFASALSEKLARRGFTVHSLCDSRRAIQAIDKERYRVVLLDVEMPFKNGLQLLSEIKGYDASIQVMMITGLCTATTAQEAFRRGAEGCFAKPVAESSPLWEALDDAFRRIERNRQALRRFRSPGEGLRSAAPATCCLPTDPPSRPS